MRPRALLPALLLAAAGPCGAQGMYHHDLHAHRCCLYIAHAGGGIDGVPYTNSEEAVLSSLRAGQRVFEIDFSRTADGVWVGTHDWRTWRRQTGYAGTLPPAYAEFTHERLKVRGGSRVLTALTIPFLEQLAAQHADMVIVTDTKNDLKGLAETLRGTTLFERLYPQAYSPDDVAMLTDMGYRRIILTVYKMDLRHPDALIAQIAAVAGRLHALTVPDDFFDRYHARLVRLGVPVYVHGPPSRINSRPLHRRLRQLGVSGFYLDW
jgi:glycerophosphoryl diester phosphodiesterase